MNSTKTTSDEPQVAYRIRWSALVKYLLAGIFFGIVLTKSEVISWYRIQEMFRFHSFHMYGIFMTAIPVALLSVTLMKRFGMESLEGEPISLRPKELGKAYRYWIGGSIFGIGWAFTGACPGPIFALIGNGVGTMFLVFLSALLGTWVYGHTRQYLPH